MNDDILLTRVQRIELRTWRLLGATILVGALTGHITFDVGEPADDSQQDDSRIMTMVCDQSGQREDGRTSARLVEPTPGLNYVEWFGPDAACEPHVTYTVLIDSDDLLSNLNRDVGDLAEELVRVTEQRDAYRHANEQLLRTVGVAR